ncbi:trypsin-7-like [Anopheles nili]|uniref:trypsin-7-like n=1 Tax=Anopheles nili TaxID=185578 RepID=UPI00237AF982|nr:trypsin-7-like [Anopheles nili]
MNVKLVLLVAIVGLLGESTKAQHRQVGGEPVVIRDYPFVAAIGYLQEYCGNGAIIQRRWILSTASTFYKQPYWQYDVAVATDDYRDDHKWYEVDKVYTPSDWVGWDHNIALVKLKEDLVYSVVVQPINMADEDWIRPLDVTMLSFGTNEDFTSHLRVATYTLTTDESCLDWIDEASRKESIYLGHAYCLIPPDFTSRAVYYNDVGAPVVKDNKLYGLLAYTKHDGAPSDVAIVTRVPFFKSWVESNMIRLG